MSQEESVTSALNALFNKKKEDKKFEEEKVENIFKQDSKIDNTKDTFDKTFKLPKGLSNFNITKHTIEDWDDSIKDMIPSRFNIQVSKELEKIIYWLVYSIENGKPISIVGPPGTGKTHIVRWVCAELGRPYIRNNGMAGLEPYDFVGGLQAKDGSTYWVDGDASIAVQHGAVFAYDEWAKSSAQVNMCFQALAENENKFLLRYGYPEAQGRRLIPHPKFSLVLCDNITGDGSGMSNYAATELQDCSFLNRVSKKLFLDYMDAKTEKQYIIDKYALDGKLANKIIQISNLMRGAWKQEQIKIVVSLRTIQEWIESFMVCGDISESFKVTLDYNNQEEKVKTVIKTFWNDVDFKPNVL